MIELIKSRYMLAPYLMAILFTSASYANLPETRSSSMPNMRATPGIVYVQIRGVVIAPPPCKINNGNLIEVRFDEVMSTRIDGLAYEKPVQYSIQCEKMPSQAMKMSVHGNTANFDNQSLETNIEGLGISLRYNNRKLAVKEEIKFTYPNTPQFSVVPVRDLSKVLKGGNFESVAIINIEYQ